VTTTLPILIYWLLLAAGLVGIARTCTLAKARLQIGAIALVLLTLTPAIALAAYSSFGKFAQWVAFPSALKEIVGNDLMVRSSLLYGRYKAERQEFESLLSQRSEISPQIDNVPEEPLTVVLVLGESASRGNHGVYGYPLATTPHMSKMKSELLLMNSAVSPATMTLDSVVRMLTHASNKNKEAWVESSSVINVAAAAGYQTWWLSNQGQLGQHDTDVTVLAKESARFQSINTSMVNSSDDMKLLPMFDEILSGEDRKQFVIMHIMGSHYDYSKRFPVEEAVLTTDDYPKRLGLDNFSQPALQRLADYDNSIRYTDQFLARTIALLEASGRNSVMVYLSDHGEELTADIKIYGHGNPLIKPVHVDVPFLVWLSEQWQQRNKDSFVVDGDREVVEGRVFSTEDLFHTLLSLLNISTDEYDATVDVLSPAYRSQEILIYSPLGDYVDYSDI
jgi:heptose-I-phosphate ethanolaminephosphotransferase